MSSTSDVHLSALRPLVLDHVITCKLPSNSIAPPPRPYVPALGSLPLLAELSGWLNHIFFRDHLRQHLEIQVRHAHQHMQLALPPTTTYTRTTVLTATEMARK
jgi:hypothetical protein